MHRVRNPAIETMIIGEVLKKLDVGKLSPELGRDGFMVG
jgi:hypothetical protein